MEKILETIRQKWAEYLLEVLVIVGSILGAFALDNWNENIENSKTEKFYIKSLKKEFEDNYKELAGDMEGRIRIIHDIKSLITSNSNRVVESDTIFMSKDLLQAIRFNVPSSAIYDDLISTGKLDLLQSDSLRYWLMVYNQEVKRNDRVEQIDFQFVHTFVIPFLITNENSLQSESLNDEIIAISKRRLSNNETILRFNQILLDVIKSVLKELPENP